MGQVERVALTQGRARLGDWDKFYNLLVVSRAWWNAFK